MGRSKQLYEDSGVELSKATINAGDEVTIQYSGLLAKSGAEAVYAHIGYGEDWKEKEFLPMENENGIFKTTFKVNAYDSLNIAFKDSGENWDNNSFENYSFRVSSRSEKAGASKTVKSVQKKSEIEKKAAAKTVETKKETLGAKKQTIEKKATKPAAPKKTTAKK